MQNEKEFLAQKLTMLTLSPLKASAYIWTKGPNSVRVKTLAERLDVNSSLIYDRRKSIEGRMGLPKGQRLYKKALSLLEDPQVCQEVKDFMADPFGSFREQKEAMMESAAYKEMLAG